MLMSVHLDVDASGEEEIVRVEFGGDDLNERVFWVPYPRGRVMLEYVARISIEDHLYRVPLIRTRAPIGAIRGT